MTEQTTLQFLGTDERQSWQVLCINALASLNRSLPGGGLVSDTDQVAVAAMHQADMLLLAHRERSATLTAVMEQAARERAVQGAEEGQGDAE